MSNPCKVIITRGKNKGKICGDINAKCKHVTDPLVCSVCGQNFDRTTSYYRHVNTLHDGRARPYGPKYIEALKAEQQQSHEPQDQEQKVKVKVPIKVKIGTVSDMFRRLAQLEQQNSELREEVAELKMKPTTTNYIAILGNDLYTELTNKIGKDKAMRFIAESGVKRPLSVFQKLYLDDRNPDDYPIACKDKCHFRYLDHRKRMVDDPGGSTIGTAVSKQIYDAVTHAVHDFEIEGHGNTVYGLEGVHSLRERFAQLDQDSVIKELAYITNNPNHPFFRDVDP